MIQPKFRHKLKGKIFENGFKTLSEFSEHNGISLSKISRIINGWEIPTPDLQERLSAALGLTMADLQKLF